MALLLENIITYLKNSKSIVLATIDSNQLPDIRTIGGYNFDGYVLYFATAKASRKAEQLLEKENVALLIQHENQVLPDYKNVTIYGRAKKLSGADYELGRAKILERRPNAVYEEESKNIYRVTPEQIKLLDLSKGVKDQVYIIKP